MAVSGGVLFEGEWELVRLLQTSPWAGADDDPRDKSPVLSRLDRMLVDRLDLERRNIRGPKFEPVAFGDGTLPAEGPLPREAAAPPSRELPTSQSIEPTSREIRTAWTVDAVVPSEADILASRPGGIARPGIDQALGAARREIDEAGRKAAYLHDLEIVERGADIRRHGRRTLPSDLRSEVFSVWDRRRNERSDKVRRASRDGSEMPFCHPSARLAQAAAAVLAESVLEEYQRRIHEAVCGRNPEALLNEGARSNVKVRSLGHLRADDIRRLEAVPEPDPSSADHAAQLSAWRAAYEASTKTGRGVMVDTGAADLRRLLRAILRRMERLAVAGLGMRVLECGSGVDVPGNEDGAACGGLYPVRSDNRTSTCSDACREAVARARRARTRKPRRR